MSCGVEIVSQSNSSKKGSNVSELVHKVSRIHSSLHGNGKPAEPFEGPRTHVEATASDESSGLATASRDGKDSTEANSLKQKESIPSKPNVTFARVQALEAFISTIFTTVSALKNAYIKLQTAHSPYNAEELQSADRAVIDELKRLSEMKHSFLERHAALEDDNKVNAAKSYEGVINSLRLEIQKKNLEVERLKDILEQTMLKKEKLERRVKKLEQTVTRDFCPKLPVAVSPTIHLFESMVVAASETARSFTKLLISFMKAAQWDLDAAANSIVSGIAYLRRSHKKYAFESHVCHRMLNGFGNANFDISNSLAELNDDQQECFNQFQDMKDNDPWEIVNAQPDCLFGKFCHKKFLDLIHPKMEESFFGNLEHRNQVESGSHPHTQFYENFLRLAKNIWLLHMLAFAFKPAASIFQARRDTEFSSIYMQSVIHRLENEDSNVQLHHKVGFSVMPGFRVGNAIIKCRVYLVPTMIVD